MITKRGPGRRAVLQVGPDGVTYGMHSAVTSQVIKSAPLPARPTAAELIPA